MRKSEKKKFKEIFSFLLENARRETVFHVFFSISIFYVDPDS